VVHIDFDNGQLSFAGAQSRGLLISKNQLVDLKGDKNSIGGINAGRGKKFNLRRLTFEQGDRLYLYTDGFYDQFGGEMEKKMLHKNFRIKIEQTRTLSMEDQKTELVDWFSEWKGNLDQIDDVTVIGVEL
jgi:serine phosphatase RsbU (regulator of sigma subunit)